MVQARRISKRQNYFVFHRKLLLLLLSFLFLIAFGAQAKGIHPVMHSIDEKLEGPESIYTNYILNLIRVWPKDSFVAQENSPNPVQLQCIETIGNPYYIGLEQFMRVNAPLGRVEEILDDINHYKDLFPGFDDIHIVSQQENKILTYWEQHVPFFFVPNVTYQVLYLTDKTSSHRKIYRYKLKNSKNLKTNDGVIIIEEDSPVAVNTPRTRYTEYDFFDADWGIVKTVAPGRIWKDSVEGIYLSDVAIKLMAEHPRWSFKQVKEESQKILELFPVNKAIEQKKKFRE